MNALSKFLSTIQLLVLDTACEKVKAIIDDFMILVVAEESAELNVCMDI